MGAPRKISEKCVSCGLSLVCIGAGQRVFSHTCEVCGVIYTVIAQVEYRGFACSIASKIPREPRPCERCWDMQNPNRKVFTKMKVLEW